jgi:hypothetical protein
MKSLSFLRALILYIITQLLPAVAVHFRGGTINWKPTGNGNEVLFLIPSVSPLTLTD